MTAPKGSGSIRERRPGVWEIRVAAGTDPVTGRTLQRSVTYRGTARDAQAYRHDLAAEYLARRSVTEAAPMLSVEELLTRWLVADHAWKPSTEVGYRSNVRHLMRDRRLAQMRVVSWTPPVVRQAIERWTRLGASGAVVGGRFRVLRSAIGWAYDERIIDHHPIRTMRGPRRPTPRRPVSDRDVRAAFLRHANSAALEAVANDTGSKASAAHRHRAQLDLLLVRLAADSGARLGELTTLQFADLDGRTLHIQRAVSAEVVTLPKSGHPRTLTLGTSTVRLWETLAAEARRGADPGAPGPWLFSSDPTHRHRLTAGALGHRFARLRAASGVSDASLHRLRHSVATFLVGRGEILQAQARLGHADPSTTLREYAYALPMTDGVVADAIDSHLDKCLDSRHEVNTSDIYLGHTGW